MRMRQIVFCGLPGSTLFLHVILQTASFEQRFIEHKMCVSIVCIDLFETFLILRRIDRDLINLLAPELFFLILAHPVYKM
jgi:hypothetical protein